MPLISVIVPVYKAESTINRCVDSILSQSFTDFELILVDDGSPDNSGAICDEYAAKDSRVKVFHKENGGVSSARNKGIDLSSGEYITFVDSDDYLLCDALSKFSISISTENADLISSGMSNEEINYEQQIKKISRQYGRKKIIIKSDEYNSSFGLMWEQDFVRSSCGKLYKTDIIKSNNLLFNTDLVISEDFNFVLDYLDKCSLVCSTDYNTYCVFDYVGRNSPLHRSKFDYTPDIRFTYNHFFSFLEKYGIDNKVSFLSIQLNDYYSAFSLLWSQPSNNLKELILKNKCLHKAYITKEAKVFTNIHKKEYSVLEYFFRLHGNIPGLKFLHIIRKFF